MKWFNGNRMRLVLVGIMAAIVLGGEIVNADFSWVQKADMPTPRRGHTSAVVNGKIYVFGGLPSEGTGSRFSTVEEFDPVINAWKKKSDMPIARAALSSSVVNGRIYTIGGGSDDGFSTVEEYDPVTDTWTRKADMPTGRWSLATCAVNGKIYAFGGLISSTPLLSINRVEEYDPSTDTWTKKSDMPMNLWALCAHVVNAKIYVLGGRPGYTAIPNVYEYDPATDTWMRKADMPVGTSQMASVVLGDKIVVIGGWLDSGCSPYKAVQIYDPSTDTWTMEADAPFLRAWCSASVVNNKIYVIGGTDKPHPCPATSTIYEGFFQKSCDFNGDGIIDSADMCIMVDHWGTDNSLYDIGPIPWGDGIVDVQDLIVLTEHLFEEALPIGLIGYWKLNETEGNIAYDSTRTNDAVVLGDPLWQPEGGIVDGAISFDGIDNYISTDFVLDPSWGAFSVFVWIQGGAPGQVIISQQSIANWLITDGEGNLMTELKCTGRSAGPLYSETVITDGQWHRIGLVWDSSHRTLYVDGIVVAEDTQHGLEGSQMGLYIGTNKAMEPGTYFSGLIDDVRIYNKALTADEIAALAQ